jgi:hypothetical protein
MLNPEIRQLAKEILADSVEFGREANVEDGRRLAELVLVQSLAHPFLLDYADGVAGHYCIARAKDRHGTYEFLDKDGRWSAAGEVVLRIEDTH